MYFTDLYERTATGTAPVDLATMKAYMKVTTTTDDTFIQALINTATDWGERYTGREFRTNTWKLLVDCFTARQRIIKNPVDSITTIKHLVSTVLTTVDAADYYKKDLAQWSEILLEDGKEWPDDTDEKEHAVEIIFDTKALTDLSIVVEAIKMHVLYLYQNRGDCAECSLEDSAKLSGAASLYNIVRIPRV